MGSLLLVRHGQASFLAANYDNLSDLGRRQCRLLGEFWAGHQVRIDRIYVGPRVRHQQSADEALAGYAACGLPAPEVVHLPTLDEFAWGELMQHAKETLAETDPVFTKLKGDFDAAVTPDEKYRTVQRLVEGVTKAWALGEIDEPHIESWPVFLERVRASIDGMVSDAPRGGRLVVFTSGGTVSAAMHHALHLPAHKTLELIWTLRNGAVTEFLFSKERFNLSAFNEAPHLPSPELWTYR